VADPNFPCNPSDDGSDDQPNYKRNYPIHLGHSHMR
jgi:hypothetical protein